MALVDFWRAAEMYRFITHSLVAKMASLVSVCTNFLGISVDLNRSRAGGELAEAQRLDADNPDHTTAIHVQSLLDLYDDGLMAHVVYRVNKWKAEKRGALPPSDIFVPAQHVVERSLAETVAAEFVNEYWCVTARTGGRDGYCVRVPPSPTPPPSAGCWNVVVVVRFPPPPPPMPRRCHVHSNFSPMCVLSGLFADAHHVSSGVGMREPVSVPGEPNAGDVPVCFLHSEPHSLAFHVVIADAR